MLAVLNEATAAGSEQRAARSDPVETVCKLQGLTCLVHCDGIKRSQARGHFVDFIVLGGDFGSVQSVD
jgi:hypothetical protein